MHEPMAQLEMTVTVSTMLSEFIFETIPQLMTQSVNNTYTNQWTSVFNITSIVLSGFVTLNGVWRFMYYSWWKGISLNQIPFEIMGVIEYRDDKIYANGGNKIISDKHVDMKDINATQRNNVMFNVLHYGNTKDKYNSMNENDEVNIHFIFKKHAANVKQN